MTLQPRCQTIFPWENIDFYPPAKPYFHLFTACIFFCRTKSSTLLAGANVRPEMEFSIMGALRRVEGCQRDTPQLPSYVFPQPKLFVTFFYLNRTYLPCSIFSSKFGPIFLPVIKTQSLLLSFPNLFLVFSKKEKSARHLQKIDHLYHQQHHFADVFLDEALTDVIVIFRTSTGTFDALRGRYFPGGPTPPEGMDADMMFKVMMVMMMMMMAVMSMMTHSP